MAKLYFRSGAMSSSKTANAIMVKYNYGEQGQRAILVKPRTDTRDGLHIMKSRSGVMDECTLFDELDMEAVKRRDYDCIIVDEAQFLSKKEVELLTDIVDDYNVPVICYGLRADFRGELFEGSKWLLAWADSIEEVKTICWCGRKATFNARVQNGHIVREGEQIMMGGNSAYVSLCRRHWKDGNLGSFCNLNLED